MLIRDTFKLKFLELERSRIRLGYVKNSRSYLVLRSRFDNHEGIGWRFEDISLGITVVSAGKATLHYGSLVDVPPIGGIISFYSKQRRIYAQCCAYTIPPCRYRLSAAFVTLRLVYRKMLTQNIGQRIWMRTLGMDSRQWGTNAFIAWIRVRVTSSWINIVE